MPVGCLRTLIVMFQKAFQSGSFDDSVGFDFDDQNCLNHFGDCFANDYRHDDFDWKIYCSLPDDYWIDFG